MKILSLICLLDQNSSQKIQAIMSSVSNKCHSQNALSFPPHFTLRNDFEINEKDLSKLSINLNQVVKRFSPLKFKLTHYGFYPWRTIYLDIPKNPILQKLHETTLLVIQKYRTNWIYKGLLENSDFSNKEKEYVQKYGCRFAFEYFSPHLTVASEVEKINFDLIKAELISKIEEVDITTNRVALLSRLDNNVITEFFFKD